MCNIAIYKREFMKRKALRHLSVNIKLLTIVFAGIILLGVILTLISTFFMRSSFDALYRERLSSSGRTLLAQYTGMDITKYVDMLLDRETIMEDSQRYLTDRLFVAEMQRNHPGGFFPSEYNAAKTRMAAYADQLSGLKDARYAAFSKSMLETRISTGVRNLYVLADIGLEDGYIYIFNTFYQAGTGIVFYDNFGTVDLKANFPEVEQAFRTGEPVYGIERIRPGTEERISHSATPVLDTDDNVVAVICVDVNLESISNQLNYFMIYSVILTLLILALILFVMLFMLKTIIIRPVQILTDISKEIAKGNVGVEIPKQTLARKDEMGALGRSYETMRVALEKLIESNKSLFEDIIIGKLDTRGDSSQFNGLFAQLIDNTNNTLDIIALYFDSVPASFVILDPQYDIAFANSSFYTTFVGFSAKQLYQELLEDNNSDYKSLKAKLSATIRQEEFACLRWFPIGGEQRCFSFICSSVAQADKKGGAIIVILDNTELVLAKDKALSANRAKSEFLSRISHELRTPLNAILSMAKLGLGDEMLSQSTSRFEKIVASSAHLSDIINDVLEMSRMESGKTEIRHAPMNVFELIGECVNMLLLKAQESNNKLVSHVEPGIPTRLVGDAFRVKQVVINLLSNAVKFTQDGTISVDVACLETNEQGCLLEFSVTDTGIGMSETFLGRIFTPFEQEDSFLSRRYAGSGLGLSISHNLVTLMGGDMNVQSELDKGSRFVFTVPFEMASGEETHGEPSSDKPEEYVSIVGKRLLLVDDIEINRMIVIEILANTGVEIEEAADGEEALAKFLNAPVGHYDCILMDIQMPKLDGYKTTVAIRQSPREDRDTPIIAMTANALKEDIDLAMACGMNGHLAKPIDFELCVQTVRKFCTEKR